MSSLTDNTIVQVDMNMLSQFASEPDIMTPTMSIETVQPTSIVGKLFRIISVTFGSTSNNVVYTCNEAKV